MITARFALCTALATGLLGAADGPTSPPPPLPPGVGEAQPATVTVPGHWDWTGSAYVWRDGATQTVTAAPSAPMIWVEGRWQKDSANRWTWIPAHFEQQGPSAPPAVVTVAPVQPPPPVITVVPAQPPPTTVVVQQPPEVRTVYVTERQCDPPVRFGLNLWVPLFGHWHHRHCR